MATFGRVSIQRGLVAVLAGLWAWGGLADEGLWLVNQPPRQLLRQRYQFELTDAWLATLQKASVRFGPGGGSGSFVSQDGLLISNHHIGSDAIQKLSTPTKNYLRDGFYARTLAEELRCPDVEVNVLESIEDVTAQVNAAVPPGANAAAAFAARRKAIAALEKQSLEQTGLRSEVVTLWQGGAYHLYRYKRYTDVRLVFAPEQQIAFFGGDPDNFEFPRHDLDICLFRVYENGRPARVPYFLRVAPGGVQEGELVFVLGHPARTSRLLTVAELEALRDVQLPFRLAVLKQFEVALANWSARHPENARRAREELFDVQNARKAWDGRLAGLLDPELFEAKRRAEADFKARLAGLPQGAAALAAYDRIAAATKQLAAQAVRYALLESGYGFRCMSFNLARTLLRAAEELPKPDGERLREFTDAARPSLELHLFSPAPIYPDLETVTLADSLTLLASQLGAANPLLQRVLAGQSPRQRAAQLIQQTRVRDLEFRRKLYQGGAAAVAEAADPMIELARVVDPEARALRKVADEQNEVRQQAYALLAQARHQLMGAETYPDATSTLRLSFGAVRGYSEEGRPVPAFTTFGALFERNRQMQNQPPFDLPPRWLKGRRRLNSATPLNFVSTCDITGGNSGSPVVNRAGEFVGIIFDGNLASLPWEYAYSDAQGRAIAVDVRAILEALARLYGAEGLVRELRQGHRSG